MIWLYSYFTRLYTRNHQVYISRKLTEIVMRKKTFGSNLAIDTIVIAAEKYENVIIMTTVSFIQCNLLLPTVHIHLISSYKGQVT